MPPADPASLVPRDIPLPLPADLMWLQVLIVILFLVHIVFVNLLVGSTLLMLRFELRSLWFGDSTSRKVARAIGQTTTVTKSLAVVFGVAPLLLINVIYTVYFYTANALTGDFWMSIVAWATAAFLLLYLHKYSWDWSVMRARPWLHWATGAAAAAILLFIPLIFLTNINLMLFPDEWPKVKGFWSALWLPNVFPRYLH
ncbi:MAG TPA: hypothetical protein VGE52_14795, partial [Pirellulales bacterium]